MNLKVEDLEREMHSRSKMPANDSSIDGGCDSLNSSALSINPQSFVLASMKEALAAASSVRQHGSINQFIPSKVNSTVAGGGLLQELNDSLAQRCNPEPGQNLLPKEYEKMLQKLEADIRGHIRLEHEMKIHLDYLEGRVEELENTNLKLSADKKSHVKKVALLEEKSRQIMQEREKEVADLKSSRVKFQVKVDAMEGRYKEQIERLNREIELYKLQQQTYISQDYNQEAQSVQKAYQQASSGPMPGHLTEKNIYQTISEGVPSKQNGMFQVQSRNSSNTNQSFQADKKQQFLSLYGASTGPPLNLSGVVSLNSTKKNHQRSRHESSKERLNGGQVNQIEMSAQKPNNFQSINPYIIDVLTQNKKSYKKKSESIDFSKKKSNVSVAQAAAKILRNSQVIPNGTSQHNNSLLMGNHMALDDPKVQQWLMTSADSDHGNSNHKAINSYMNTDYGVTQQLQPSSFSNSRNFDNPTQTTGSNQQRFNQAPSYKVKIDNAHNNTISILSNNFVMPEPQTTLQQYAQQPLLQQKKKSQSTIRHSADMNYSAIQKSHSISRPLSQLAKQQQQQQVVQSVTKQKERSQGKLRSNNYQNPLSQFFDLTSGNNGSHSHNTTAAVDQLIQAQLRQKKLNQTSSQQYQTYAGNPMVPPGISNGSNSSSVNREFYSQQFAAQRQ